MELRNISHFLTVIETGTFSAAARRLGLSQQALSASIAKLEKDFDARLFDRTSGIAEVKLTLFGDTVLRHARRIRLEAERIRSEIELLKTAHSGEVRLGVGAEALAGRLVPEAIEQMRNTVPGTKMVIWEDYSDRMMADLLDGRLDIVAGTIPAAWHLRTDLQLHPLFEMDMRVLARADHPLSGRSGLTIRDLVGFTWLVGERSAGEYEAISHAFIDAGVTPPTDLIWSDSVITGTALLLRNNFLVLAPPDLHATLMDADLIVQLDVAAPTQKLRAYVAHLRERPLSPVAQALVDAILRIAVSHNGSGPPGGKPATKRAPRKGRAKAQRASQP